MLRQCALILFLVSLVLVSAGSPVLAQEQAAPPAEEKQPIHFAFKGGTATELVDQVAQTIGCRVVLATPDDRTLPAFEAEAESPGELFVAVARNTRLVIREGYLLAVPGETQGETEVRPSVAPRPLGKRDHQKLPFVNQPNTIADQFIAQLALHIHMPIVVEPPPLTQPVGVNVGEIEVIDLLRQIAEYLKRDLVPVYAAAPTDAATIADILAGLSDEDLPRMSERLSGEGSGTPEERTAAFQRFYSQFQQESPLLRAQRIQLSLNLLHLLMWRIDRMAPDARDTLLGRIRPITNDALAFYRGLSPSARAELKPIFDFIQQRMGG